jgi:triacylglycerol lipase
MNYRLAPEYLFPAGAEDVAAVIDWLGDNIETYAGDPKRIYVVAQSAGAIHSASAIFDRRFSARHLSAIRAAILMSGVYEITPDHEEGNINLYFGNDPAELEDRSPANHVRESDVPVILTVAEIEPAFFGRSAAALMHALTIRDRRPGQIVWLKGHNHLSAVLNLGGAGDELGPAMVAALRAYP